MVQELSPGTFRLDRIDEWYSGDDRTIEFAVVDGSGAAIDISGATERWMLVHRAYEDRADSVLDDGAADVTLAVTDAANGTWEVDVAADATAGLWGSYTQVVEVEDAGGDTDIWAGEVILTA